MTHEDDAIEQTITGRLLGDKATYDSIQALREKRRQWERIDDALNGPAGAWICGCRHVDLLMQAESAEVRHD